MELRTVRCFDRIATALPDAVQIPDRIEIVPPDSFKESSLTIPGSKSITNRALVLAALADRPVKLQGALWSEDTQVMVDCLSKLGIKTKVVDDPLERSNRTIHVEGRGGELASGGSLEQPVELFVGNAGTAARFLTAMVCLGKGAYRLSGVPRMHERPQRPLFEALRSLGYNLISENNQLPVVVEGRGPVPGKCHVSLEGSSQFASALLLSGYRGRWQVTVTGADDEESSYVRMTKLLMAEFPYSGGAFQIEPDASSGSYFAALDLLWTSLAKSPGTLVQVRDWPSSGWQIDEAFPVHAHRMMTNASQGVTISRKEHLADSIMTAIVLAPFAPAPVRFTELGRLRLQECERVQALRTELTRCGASVYEEGDTLTVHPSHLHGAEINTYNDHRMAMCFAVAGTRVPGLILRDPRCVRKTFPDFFQKLAALPPYGLGLAIRNPSARKVLQTNELFAE